MPPCKSLVQSGVSTITCTPNIWFPFEVARMQIHYSAMNSSETINQDARSECLSDFRGMRQCRERLDVFIKNFAYILCEDVEDLRKGIKKMVFKVEMLRPSRCSPLPPAPKKMLLVMTLSSDKFPKIL
ncbi:hypothetical protein ACTXT7_006501 [Hymenolepis weldensis]